MQRSPFTPTLHIHISTSSQELLYCFSITSFSSRMNRPMFTAVFAEEVGDFIFIMTYGVI